jgi:hypothetical protein
MTRTPWLIRHNTCPQNNLVETPRLYKMNLENELDVAKITAEPSHILGRPYCLLQNNVTTAWCNTPNYLMLVTLK